MAEYYPLLDRAVTGLTESTVEARRSIYERARTALIGQLRRMDPPVPEEDIAREGAALDEAIARVEARFADAPPPETAPPPPARPAAPAPPRVPPPPLPTGSAPPVLPPSRERPVLGTRPAPSLDRPPGRLDDPTLPARGLARPAPAPAARGTRPVVALRPVVPESGERTEAGLPQAGRLAATPDAPPAPDAAATPRDDAFGAALDAVGRPDALGKPDPVGRRDDVGRPDPAGETGTAAEDDMDVAAPPRSRDAPRPPAPRPARDRRFGWPAIAGGIVLCLVFLGIGIAAYRMRDRPEQVVATRTAAAPDTTATPGKTVERAAVAETSETPAESTTGASVPAPIAQSAADAAPAPAAPSVAVAQRAALLVDAPDEPQRVKTYVGTVVWHLDSVSPGQGQPLATAVKADIDIPDAKLKVTMLMQRNPEPQLPASHTIEFHFLPQPGNTLGSVKQVNVPEMRKDDDAPTGDPLAGVPVAITDNYFLVGLSRGGAEGQNLRLITERNWFDMSLLFVSGKLGKLTFEKGAAGQRIFEDALKSWK